MTDSTPQEAQIGTPQTAGTLDPIVSLSVAIAESPGSYAFFLGSGVSRDAGIPTGTDVFWRTVAALYRLENDSEETPDQAALQAWLEETGRSDLTYSAVLELVAPSREDRRAYLAGLFEGHEPGDAHRRLAALAKEGLVTVFVTTNFDRLLEQALTEAGVTPVVVTSDADLAVAPSREHAACYVVKPHGDYLQQTIRNTEEELASLDLSLTAELQAIFDRYGLVVLGYSGSDKAIAACIQGRRSRYGLYWLSRAEELDERGRTLVESNAGRVIVRPDAATFLTDLDRMLTLYRAHPSGQTPELVNAEIVNLLRRPDEVGLRELLKGERRRIMETARAGARARHGSAAIGADFLGEIMPPIERYLAAVFPLIEHGSPLWAEEARALGVFAAERLSDEGLVMWIEVPRWVAWYVTYAAGGFAIAVDNLGACRTMFETTVSDDFYASETLGTLRPRETATKVAAAAMEAGVIESQNFYSPHFEHVVRSLEGSAFLQSRYPEFAASYDRLLENLYGFNALATLVAAKNKTKVGGDWTIMGRGVQHFVTRLVRDESYRERVGELLGISAEQLLETAPGLLNDGCWKPAGYIRADIELIFRRA